MTDPKGVLGTEPLADDVPLEALDGVVGGALLDAGVEVDEVPVKW